LPFGVAMLRIGPFVTLAILIVVLMNLAPAAMAQDSDGAPPEGQAQPSGRHCPDNPAGTFRFFERSGETEQDKAKLETLSPLAKQQRSVCLLSLVDPTQLQSRRIAVRRLKWVMDNLVKNGVPRNIISYELRPQAADPDTMRQVQVIFGK